MSDRTVLLKNGNVISEDLLRAYNSLLRILFMHNAIALRDFVLYCRDPERQMHPANIKLMVNLGIMKPDHTPYPVFKDYVLCTVIGDGIEMEIIDPRVITS